MPKQKRQDIGGADWPTPFTIDWLRDTADNRTSGHWNGKWNLEEAEGMGGRSGISNAKLAKVSRIKPRCVAQVPTHLGATQTGDIKLKQWGRHLEAEVIQGLSLRALGSLGHHRWQAGGWAAGTCCAHCCPSTWSTRGQAGAGRHLIPPPPRPRSIQLSGQWQVWMSPAFLQVGSA